MRASVISCMSRISISAAAATADAGGAPSEPLRLSLKRPASETQQAQQPDPKMQRVDEVCKHICTFIYVYIYMYVCIVYMRPASEAQQAQQPDPKMQRVDEVCKHI